MPRTIDQMTTEEVLNLLADLEAVKAQAERRLLALRTAELEAQDRPLRCLVSWPAGLAVARSPSCTLTP